MATSSASDDEGMVPTFESLAEPQVHDSNRDRLTVRFPGLKDLRPPVGFMHIDEALDHLGAHRFSLEWGQSPVWKEHPFRYDEETERFRTYRVRRTDDLLWEVKRQPLKEPHDDQDLKRADHLYKEVVAELSDALETGCVAACYVNSSNEPENIPRLTWTGADRLIFYTGFVYSGRVEGRRAAERRRRVLITRSSFGDWIDPPAPVSRTSKSLSDRAVTAILDVLTAHASVLGMKYKRQWLQDLVQTVLSEQGLPLAKTQFEERIWADPRLKPFKFPKGPPTAEAERTLGREEPRVRAAIADAYLKVTRGK
jgi:hypothetical protein